MRANYPARYVRSRWANRIEKEGGLSAAKREMGENPGAPAVNG